MESIPSRDMQSALECVNALASAVFRIQVLSDDAYEILMNQLLIFGRFSHDQTEMDLVRGFVQEVKDEYERED